MRVTTVKYNSPADELLNAWGAERTSDRQNNVNRLTDVRGIKTLGTREWVITDEIRLTDADSHAALYLLRNWRTGLPMIAALTDLGNTY